MSDSLKIKAIYGMEPMREGEYPTTYIVGSQGVNKIEFNMVNYGDHGIGQYDVYRGDKIIATVLHRALSEIQYYE